MMRHTIADQGQRGQAIAEMTVMIGAVSLLFLGICHVGKFHDSGSVIQAAHYSAWERTVHSPAQMSAGWKASLPAPLLPEKTPSNSLFSAMSSPDTGPVQNRHSRIVKYAIDKILVAGRRITAI